MGTELWQLIGAFVAFCIVLTFWISIVYLPGRTLERWEDQRPEACDDDRDA